MAECDEIAISIADTLEPSLIKACAEDICQCDDIVYRHMAESSMVIRSNVAESLHYICKQRSRSGPVC